MTTARSSRHGRSRLALTIGLAVVVGATALAHRRDEYLQAARIALDPGSLQIELDLTPGIALAQGIADQIDRDSDGAISDAEAAAYAARVVRDVEMRMDGRLLPLRVTERLFPTVAAMLDGEGTIRLRLSAEIPRLAAGPHLVSYRSDHRPDISVYLANALLPTDERVSVRGQTRDVNQRGLVIDYALRNDRRTPHAWLPSAGLAAVLTLMTGWLWRRSQARSLLKSD